MKSLSFFISPVPLSKPEAINSTSENAKAAEPNPKEGKEGDRAMWRTKNPWIIASLQARKHLKLSTLKARMEPTRIDAVEKK
jgi:hypothetical protein